jgi:hypothetical protein
MSLKDTIDSLADSKIKRDNYCPYQTMYDSLKPEDKKALDEAWAKGYSANIVLAALRQEGIKSSNEAIRMHKQGLCKCEKK